MAEPCTFDEENNVLGAPQGVSSEEVQALSVCHTQDQSGTPLVISCWKLTAEELAEVNRTGRVWLGIWGRTMPPAWVAGQKPFQR